MSFAREVPRSLARALRNVHPRAEFVYKHDEGRWWVARHVRSGSTRAAYDLDFALVDHATNRPVQPCPAVLPFARYFYDFKRDPERHLRARFDKRKAAYERWLARDRENTEKSAADVLAWLKKEHSRLGLPLPGVHGLDRQGRDELLRTRNPEQWHELQQAMGNEEPPAMLADLAEDYTDKPLGGE